MSKPETVRACEQCTLVKNLSDYPLFRKLKGQRCYRGPVCKACKFKLDLLDVNTRKQANALEIATAALREMYTDIDQSLALRQRIKKLQALPDDIVRRRKSKKH